MAEIEHDEFKIPVRYRPWKQKYGIDIFAGVNYLQCFCIV